MKWLQVLAETESDESIEKGEVTDDSEEEDQVDAYGIDVEEKMTEIANKKMLELELPLEDLPKDVLEMIEEGPQSRPVREGCTSERSAWTERGHGFKYFQKLSDESIEEGEVTDDSEEDDQVDANGTKDLCN